MSREATVRRLLEGYIDRQRALTEGRRLTHISTVLHYPSCLGAFEEFPATGRLAIRISPALAQAAVSCAYRIPGHAYRQSHLDYTSRPLTDAVVTAIRLEETFVDFKLEDLPPLLEHRQADGLWRLVVAATLTHSERVARHDGSEQLRYLLTEGQVMWHSPRRTQMALHVARRLFTGSEASANLVWVGEQRKEFDNWVDNLQDTRVIRGGHEFTEGALEPLENAEGRAATAVWRAERLMALDDLARVLTDPSSKMQELIVLPPGWVLCSPAGWRAVHFPGWEPPTAIVQEHVDRGRALRIDYGSRSALWPVTASQAPVAGFEHVVAGARALGLTPIQIVEAVLVTREVNESKNEEPREPQEAEKEKPAPTCPWFPVATAHELGLVDQAARDRIVEDAQEQTRRRIRVTLAAATRHYLPQDEAGLERLSAASRDLHQFAQVAHELDLRFWITPAVWTWEVNSIPSILASGTASPAQLQALGRQWCRQVRLALERDMERAWHAAMWRARLDVVDPTGLDDP